ncbi:hypothetical protein [Streptomyces griseomycini]|uniref:Uncharacterized protein n=1 Tax=Streptomyces griseomycini TaxID=66895 RepID=A0A7W7PTT3_9ACTN|nr:hypothetical protein [Streptomyces griseomycini]MBB4901178.1 hypothetical protein [Streptomyces griseomycini]GGR17481.1 hypothetical protein GCM10015536_23990 [Streptomyces griseomycini]
MGELRRLGRRRPVRTHTVSALPEETAVLERAMGADPRTVRVLLTAADVTVAERPAGRGRGSELEREVRKGLRTARLPEERTPADAVRVAADGGTVVDIAREVVAATGRAAGG